MTRGGNTGPSAYQAGRDAETRSGAFPKAEFDWYVEQQWVTRALIEAERNHEWLGGWGTVWDPACGGGNVLKAFSASHKTHASDLHFRGFASRGLFVWLDFCSPIERVGCFAPQDDFSVVSNPPFSYEPGIAEAFVRQALALATNKVAMLLPVKWQASEGRHALFTQHPPARVWVLSERPSMPPGEAVAALGDAAFKRGRIDFNWIVWDVREPTAPGDTRWGTIAPRAKAERRP